MRYELFSSSSTNEYFNSRLEELRGQIEKLTDDEILGSEFSEWEVYFCQRFEVHPIELFEAEKTQTIEETKVKQYNSFRFLDEPEFYYLEGVRITYKIPFDGDFDLLYLRPSTYRMTKFSCDKVVPPKTEECGYILFSNDYPNSVLEQNRDNMQQYVSDGFNRSFSNHREMIQYVNSDVREYNSNLKLYITEMLNARKKRASSFALITQKLEIPIKLSKNAPNIKPIVLKQRPKPVPQKPKPKPAQQEYCISDEDFSNINNIVYMCGSSLEKTARSHISNDEEELRDIILATLNTHYYNASGETFRKTGKTDIQILFENQAAFIGECKVWRGDKVFENAIRQLLSYSTWKDIKVSLIFFNKHNKNFLAILSDVENWIELNTISHTKLNANRWNCVYYRKDTQVNIELQIVVFDLYVDEPQKQ